MRRQGSCDSPLNGQTNGLDICVRNVRRQVFLNKSIKGQPGLLFENRVRAGGGCGECEIQVSDWFECPGDRIAVR